MPISIQDEGRYLLARYHGRLTGADLLSAAKAAHEIESNARTLKPRIVDFSEVTHVDIRFEDMDVFAKLREKSKLPHKTKSAIVAPGLAQYGFARMYQLLNANPDLDVQVFTELQPALDWILRP